MTDHTANIGSLPTIEDEISALRQHITSYRNVLNQEGIWLFLVTLGCWSVSNNFLQFVALLLAVTLFGDRMNKRLLEKRSFLKLVDVIKDRIMHSLAEEDSRKARLYDLDAMKSELSALNNIKNTWVFFLCWIFWGVSLMYAFLHTLKFAD